MSGANSAGKSGSSSSSSSSALSFSGGAAAGWVIKIANEGPTIYHTGDTNVFADMGLIDELYKPTHVLMPMGEQCTMGAYDAAYACKEFLTNCQTFIPMHFKTTNANELQNQVSSDTFLESCMIAPNLLESFKNELSALGLQRTRIVDSEQELLGRWLDLTVE